MSLITSTYPGPPFYLFNSHLETLIPAIYRKMNTPPYRRERLELEDGDFLDLDWVKNGYDRLAVLSHGLEGNSSRHYIKGLAHLFIENSWDVLAWNCRSCSGELNRKLRMYFHGDEKDLATVIDHVTTPNYREIILVGVSMGGSFTLKYLGIHSPIPEPIKGAVAISTPCDLAACAETLNYRSNRIYRARFLDRLTRKIKAKAAQFPGAIDLKNLEKIERWQDFDEYFSAPINGFSSAAALYYSGSATHFMEGIKIPTLLLNAQNDPILTPSCSPERVCKNHPFLHLETPRRGGHVGFQLSKSSYSWAEKRTLEFVKKL